MTKNSTLTQEPGNPRELKFLSNNFPTKNQNAPGANPKNHHRNLAYPKIYPSLTLNNLSPTNHLNDKLPK